MWTPAGQDDRLRPPLQESADEVLFAVQRIFGVAEQHLQAGDVEDLGHAAHRVGEVRVVERGHERRDEARATGGEHSRRRVRHIAGLLHDLEDAVPRLPRDGASLFRARETVIAETPAIFATVCIVTALACGSDPGSPGLRSDVPRFLPTRIAIVKPAR